MIVIFDIETSIKTGLPVIISNFFFKVPGRIEKLEAIVNP
jgi:hypothetical protein